MKVNVLHTAVRGGMMRVLDCFLAGLYGEYPTMLADEGIQRLGQNKVCQVFHHDDSP